MKTRSLIVAVLAAAGWTTHAPASCGSTFCSVNTNWGTQGVWTEPGLRLDLRAEYIDQDQPRSGNTDVGIGQIPRDHEEVRTVNRNWLATFDYTVSKDWGLTVSVPVVDRHHEHIHHGSGAAVSETWDFTELGDVRVLGRYQRGVENNATAGVQFGVKLPTGRYHLTNADGELAERTLQPGTGTTDFVFGAYYHRDMLADLSSWFVQGLYQAPIAERDDFKPGYRLSFDLGMRYDLGRKLGAVLQLNTQVKGRDGGAAAEPEDSGKTLISLSPGLSYALSRDMQVYGFVQLPIYEHVNGVQLTAERALAVGISTRL